jgi:hypothetical protein
MGYNEADYFYKRREYPNCIIEYIAPVNYVATEKFVKPSKMAKEYKFKLDRF